MSRGEVRSVTKRLNNVVEREAKDKLRQAFLLIDYNGDTRDIFIQLGDPALGRGAVVRARIKPGTASMTSGSPVTVVCRHGHWELIV